MIRVHWKHLAIALAVLPAAALLFAWIGFFNVGASTGHWKITDWFLHFAMRSAVRTYALAVDVPEMLPDQAIQPAAGHYARGCAVCHGAPGEARSPAVMHMLPRPPDLAPIVDDWSDAELFRIVRHGVRFTGMPAWPSQARDDEVWAMVAFLRRLPGLDAQTYRSLAHGQAALVTAQDGLPAAIAECARCHGEDGMGRSPVTPILAGQSAPYLAEALRAYRAGERESGVMALPATAVDEAQIDALAEHFATLPRIDAKDEPGSVDDLATGERIAREGVAERGIPACLSCHAGDARNPLYPRLDGQPAPYLSIQLGLFRDGERGTSRYAQIMTRVAKGLEDDEIAALSAYFASAPAQPATEAP